MDDSGVVGRIRRILSYLPVDHTQLLCRQIVERKQESVVEVSLSAQRAVVDVRLLLVVLVSVEPAEKKFDDKKCRYSSLYISYIKIINYYF